MFKEEEEERERERERERTIIDTQRAGLQTAQKSARKSGRENVTSVFTIHFVCRLVSLSLLLERCIMDSFSFCVSFLNNFPQTIIMIKKRLWFNFFLQFVLINVWMKRNPTNGRCCRGNHGAASLQEEKIHISITPDFGMIDRS